MTDQHSTRTHIELTATEFCYTNPFLKSQLFIELFIKTFLLSDSLTVILTKSLNLIFSERNGTM
jgi:hypothetical protein